MKDRDFNCDFMNKIVSTDTHKHTPHTHTHTKVSKYVISTILRA